jgi:hypothetical protein
MSKQNEERTLVSYNARILSGRLRHSRASGAVNGTVECTFVAKSRDEAADIAQQESNRLNKRMWLSLIGSDTELFIPHKVIL